MIKENELQLSQKAEEKPLYNTRKIFSDAEMMKLVHELEVYQLELEMQNEELVLAKEKAEHAEKKYTELYDFAPSGYLCLNKKGEITELNLMASNILGKERLLLIKNRLQLFVSNESRSVFNQFLHDVFSYKVKQTCEIQLNTDKAQAIFLNIEGIIAHDGEQCFLTLMDVTKNKETTLELTKAKEHAEESDRLKSAFLSNMSHEIRTPMNGILGFAQLLADQDLSIEKQQNYISIIEKSGRRMLNIINDIIDISKIESGLMLVKTTKSHINKQMEYIHTFFNPDVDEKGMKLFVKNGLTDELALVNTDCEKVDAIMINLVKNAINFSKDGSIEFGYIKKGAWLEFFVKDTGLGIPKNKQKSIFERFVQAESSNKKVFNGTGLGLSISKSYVEMLGGTIWLESTEGVGTTFYFTIPYICAT